MNRTIIANIMVAFALACAGVPSIYAQEYISTPVTVSKEKVRVNGKVCYSHIVREKQTLFSIAKAYGVTVEDIYSFNPTLKETGLKKNAIILIPSAEALSEAVQTGEQQAASEVVEVKPETEPKADIEQKAAEDTQLIQDTQKKMATPQVQ